MDPELRALAERARAAAIVVRKSSAAARAQAIRAMAAGLRVQRAAVLAANAADLAGAQALGPARRDRLTLTDAGIEAMAQGLEAVAALPDPVGRVFDERIAPSGMRVRRVRGPIGVLFLIYEARPNVTADAAAIALKAGNAVLLRGGSEARASNAAIVAVLAEALAAQGLPPAAVQAVPRTDHAAVHELLQLDSLIDLVIPRGGEALIRDVVEHSRIPVLKHYRGNCHIYVDVAADLDLAERLVENAKVQRPATCNAAEKVLVHAGVAFEFLPRLAARLPQVELRGDPAACALVSRMKLASEADWHAEYLDLVLGVRVVSGLDEAMAHIQRYGSSHTDAIVTRDPATARRFLDEVDSASVLWNVSTRMADGGCYGLGAEIGIGTDKLHARGPMGVEELTTLKWVVEGEGQVRS